MAATTELSTAIDVATEAIKLDEAGQFAAAKAKFVEAADWLLIVLKREAEPARREKLAERIDNYLSRAEALKKRADEERRRPKPPKQPTRPATPPTPPSPEEPPVDSRSRTSTATNYFTADELFRRDVERARGEVAAREALRVPFEDAAFPASRAALVGATGAFEKAGAAFLKRGDVAWWRRPSDILGGGTSPPKLFPEPAGPTPRDVDQGSLGDCWLLSSLCVLAGFPDLIRRLVVASSTTVGCYVCRLCYEGRWRLVMVDDRLPCRTNGQCAFAQPAGDAGAVWCAVLEKAVAKLHGAYAALEEGTAAEALGLLTGLPTHTIEHIDRIRRGDDTTASSPNPETTTTTPDATTTSSSSSDQPETLAALYERIRAAHAAGSIISACCGHTAVAETEYATVGLRHAHEYAVLRVADDGATRLLELRNPWARGEWKGRWSRADRASWSSPTGRRLLATILGGGQQKNTTTASAAEGGVDEELKSLVTDDGVFWMQLEDVATYFSEITVCRLRRNFSQRRLPVVEPDAKKPPATLASPYRAFVVRTPRAGDEQSHTANDAATSPKPGVPGTPATILDACLVQATERGKLPRGHHVVADATLCIFGVVVVPASSSSDDAPRPADAHAAARAAAQQIVAMPPASLAQHLSLAAASTPGLLAPVVAAEELACAPATTYLVLPVYFNWRVVRREWPLTAVFYSSRPVDVHPIDLPPASVAACLRVATLARGRSQAGGRYRRQGDKSPTTPTPTRERLYDWHGLHLIENAHPTKRLTVTQALGKCSNLVSSRHGGVVDPNRPSGAYVVQDTLPPRTFMFALFRSPFRPSWSIDTSTFSWKFDSNGATAHHAPPLLPQPSLHSVFPLPADDDDAPPAAA